MTSTPSVGIVYKRRHERARLEAASLETWLQKRGVETFSEEMGVAESPVEMAILVRITVGAEEELEEQEQVTAGEQGLRDF